MKIDAARSKLEAKIRQEIDAAVRVALEDPSVSHSSFLGRSPFQRELAYKAFRRKMLNSKVWEPIQELLARTRIDYLLIRAALRHERASESAQIPLPGFEDLPRRIRIGRSSVDVLKSTVAQILQRAERIKKRAQQNTSRDNAVLRLADKIRDQPGELSIQDALARIGDRQRQTTEPASARRR